jgi:hypothetical protein
LCSFLHSVVCHVYAMNESPLFGFAFNFAVCVIL